MKAVKPLRKYWNNSIGGIKMKKLLILIGCLLLSLAMAGCGGNANMEKKVLRVATTANFPPFEYFQPNSGIHTGFDIDLMRELGKGMGYDKVEFVNVDFSKLLDGLQEKQYDAVISGLAITPEREARVAFTKPYVSDGLTIVLPVGTKFPNEPASLKGKRVAVESGSIAFDWVMSQTHASDIIVTDNTEEAIKAVVEDRADCMVASKLAVAFLLAHGFSDSVRFAGDNVLVEDQIGMAVSKDNTVLLEKLNGELEKYRKTPAYKQLFRTYFGGIK